MLFSVDAVGPAALPGPGRRGHPPDPGAGTRGHPAGLLNLLQPPPPRPPRDRRARRHSPQAPTIENPDFDKKSSVKIVPDFEIIYENGS